MTAQEKRLQAIEKLIALGDFPIELPDDLFLAWMENARQYPHLIAAYRQDLPDDCHRYLMVRGDTP